MAQGSLTAWANFQGPFTLHGVAAAALGLKGDRFRLLTPPDSGGSFGIKASVLAYVVLMGLASRKLGVPVTWIEDRLEHLAASAAATGRMTEVEAGFTSDGELARAPLRRDRGRRRVRSRTRAGDALPHARLAVRGLPVRRRGSRNRVVLTNTIPSGLNRGFGGPQLYFGLERTMAIAARLGLDPVELARRNLVRRRRCPTGRRPVRSTTPATTRAASTRARARALRRAARGARRLRARTGRLVGVGLACVVEPSISNMGYITLAEPAEEREGFRSRATRRAHDRDRPARRDHGAAGVDAAGPGPPHGIAQVVADALGVRPRRST